MRMNSLKKIEDIGSSFMEHAFNTKNYRKCGNAVLPITLVLFFSINPSVSVSETLTANKIMGAYANSWRVARIEELEFQKFDSTTNTITGSLKMNHYTKVIATSGNFMRMMIILAPTSAKGVRMLIREHVNGIDDIWIITPAMKKSRRVTEFEKNRRFMDTEFTYSDILIPMTGDYNHSILKLVRYNGANCFLIESIPASYKVRKKMGICRILNWIRHDDLVGLKTEIYNMDRRCMKTIRRSKLVEYDTINHRWIPLKSVIVNEQTKMKTIMESHNVSFDTIIPDAWFTVEQMEKK